MEVFYIENLAKFNLARHMLNLARTCLVTGHYHKPCCITQNFENLVVHNLDNLYLLIILCKPDVCRSKHVPGLLKLLLSKKLVCVCVARVHNILP